MYESLEVSPAGSWSDAAAAVRILREFDDIYVGRDGVDYSGAMRAYDFQYFPDAATQCFLAYVEFDMNGANEEVPSRIIIDKGVGAVFPPNCLDATIEWIVRNQLCLRELDKPEVVALEDVIAWWRR